MEKWIHATLAEGADGPSQNHENVNGEKIVNAN